MTQYKIIAHDTKEYHCKQALKAFDPSCVITIDKDDNTILLLETDKLDLVMIKSLTSVKEVTELNNTMTFNWTYTPPIIKDCSGTSNIPIYGNTIYGGWANVANPTILNTNPNGTCLQFNEVKNKIRVLSSVYLSHINFNSSINLLNNSSGVNYIIPAGISNSRVIDILHSNNDIYDHNKCYVCIHNSVSGPWLSFDGNAPLSATWKNVIDVYENPKGIVTIVYV